MNIYGGTYMFSDKLRKLREDKGLTQQELANQLFVTRSAVAKWEQGRGVPNPDSMESIAIFFNVEKNELLSQEDAMKVLYTLQASSEKSWKQSFIFLCVLFSLLGVTLVGIFLWKELQREKLYYNEYFKESSLSAYSIPDLLEIEHQGVRLSTSSDNYFAVVDDSVDIEAYASYVLNYLLESPHISFVGFDMDRATEKYEVTDNKFIAPSTHINDYKYGLGYQFLYIDFLESDRSIQSPIHFKSITINNSYYTIIEDQEYNFIMSLRDTRSYSNYDYYLFDEFYDANIIKINTENIENYFDIVIEMEEYVNDYFMVIFDYDKYFVHANIEVNIVVQYEDQVFEEHKIIKKGYDWSTYIFIHTDTSGWDEENIQLVSCEVVYGDLWILE